MNAVISIAGGRRAEAFVRLEALASSTGVDKSLANAALEAGLWLALDDNLRAASEPLERVLAGDQP
ncbi:MAG: hypothetical protein EA402_05270 [Planctomycetota bacterium]|nr:MAG: hypothetical protein EA402_05270 [Planctomycetota bacterium]